jgi:hypothetical protein
MPEPVINLQHLFRMDGCPHHCISLSQSSGRQDSARENHRLNRPMSHPQHVEYSRNMSCCPGAQAAVLETLSVTAQFLGQTEGSPLAFNGGNPLAAPKTAPWDALQVRNVALIPLRGGCNIKGVCTRGILTTGGVGSKSWRLRLICGRGRI